MSNIELRPTYWASVSGGKDSLFMLYYVLQNLDRYPLDGVVHFELEMDFPFIHDVVDMIESDCKKYGIPIFRIKPRRTWEELYHRVAKNGWEYKYPTKMARWCNNEYKLDCVRQLESMMKSQGKRVINYIGFCADEVKRFRFELNDRGRNVTQIYPLAENGFQEDVIWEWAKKQPIYNGYYLENKRCGCICCPMASLDNLVYAKTHYPEMYEYFMGKAIETEAYREKQFGRPISVWSSDADYNTKYRMRRVDQIIENRKYQGEQYSLFEEVK